MAIWRFLIHKEIIYFALRKGTYGKDWSFKLLKLSSYQGEIARNS
jgi:hypothetical protein